MGDCTSTKAAVNELAAFDTRPDVVSFSALKNSPVLQQSVVAHRGWHSKVDRDRPLENTVEAFVYAWQNGAHRAECDVQLTKDEVLVINHDLTLARLARDPTATIAQANLCDVVWDDVKDVPLNDGSLVPRLDQVLEAALRIGPHAKLVVEIKPDAGSVRTAELLFELLQSRPELRAHVAIVMSFDPDAVKRFATLKYTATKANESTPVDEEEANAAEVDQPRLLLLTHIPSEEFPQKCALLLDFTRIATEPKYADFLLQVPNPDDDTGLLLDGFYLRFDKNMLDGGAGQAAFRDACVRFDIGVWLKNQDADTVSVVMALVGSGAAYVNSDLELNDQAKG
jgi:glycerophosphoryl diester phosphodiesterase